MKKERDYDLTDELLVSYRDAALDNSRQLIEEAQLLFSKEHYARTYFLALASIEETGKAKILFDAMGRDLNDLGLCKVIKRRIEMHSNKITSAFVAWLHNSEDKEKAIQEYVDISVNLKRGREKSMYTDVKSNILGLSVPSEVVRPVAARDCVHLAVNCLHHTEQHIKINEPRKTSKSENKFYCLNTDKINKMMNTEDYWEYYVAQLKQGNDDNSMISVKYYDEYFSKNKIFKVQS